MLGLAGCEQPRQVADIAIPFDNSVGFLDRGYLLRVPKQTQFTWEGLAIDEDTLEKHLHQIAKRPNGGHLFVQIETGVSTQKANLIRQKSLKAAYANSVAAPRSVGIGNSPS